MNDKRARRLSVKRPFARVLLLGAYAVAAASLHAQPVVQALPDPAASDLGEALQRLGRDPQSLPALLSAGRASLQLGDLDAARGFFVRAEAIAPADGRVMAGRALVELKEQNPLEALRHFDLAERAGEPLGAYAADRGLAYDLVGANLRAQQLYAESLAAKEEPEVLRRLALSYAIAGHQDASEATLLPLLQASDLAAFRTRAFVLAIGGKAAEAETIASTMLPERIARRLSPYLAYMPRLTRAQQAAAANLGQFPSAGMIGRDDPEVAAYGSGTSAPPLARAAGGADARLIPGGQPLGTPPAETVLPVSQEQAQIVIPVAALEPTGAQLQEDAPPGVATEAQGAVQLEAAPSELVGITQPQAPDLPAEPPSTAPTRISLGEAFAEFELPPEATAIRPAAGAVDITQITPLRQERPKVQAPPPDPSRQWVQVATGQDISAFRFDWRRIARNAAGLLEGKDAFYAAWGGSNRLMTGPFASAAEAQAFVTKLAAAGIDSFRYGSAVGEKVSPLP